jgi:hypothetical protein
MDVIRVERMMRAVARRMAEPLCMGSDAELIEARGRAPEPTRFDYPAYRVPLRRSAPFSYRDFNAEVRMEAIRTATFERVLARTAEGSTFWVWKCTSDGCHYL